MGTPRRRVDSHCLVEPGDTLLALWLVDYSYQCIGVFINSMDYRGRHLANIETGYFLGVCFSGCFTDMDCNGHWIPNFDIEPIRGLKKAAGYPLGIRTSLLVLGNRDS